MTDVADLLARFHRELSPRLLEEAMAAAESGSSGPSLKWQTARVLASNGWSALNALIERELDSQFDPSRPMLLRIPRSNDSAEFERKRAAHAVLQTRYRLQVHLRRVKAAAGAAPFPAGRQGDDRDPALGQILAAFAADKDPDRLYLALQRVDELVNEALHREHEWRESRRAALQAALDILDAVKAHTDPRFDPEEMDLAPDPPERRRYQLQLTLRGVGLRAERLRAELSASAGEGAP
jgi:hypothetical protein